MAEYICKNGILRPIRGIYQCVDKLIEGVDYERYDWLKGDGKSYIQTKQFLDSTDIVRMRYNNHSSGIVFGAGMNTGVPQYKYSCGSNLLWFGVDIHGPISLSTLTAPPIREVVIQDGKVTFVGLRSYTTNSNNEALNKSPYTALLFGYKAITYTSRVNSEFSLSYFKIDNKVDFVPVQLLRQISAQLSSDNKPHPSGECGMYDSVSGKFFGNANTTGAFSVYND